jgi:hypothetical protein
MRRTPLVLAATRSLVLAATSALLFVLPAGQAAARPAPLSITGAANCSADGGTFANGVCDLPAATVAQRYEAFIVASGGSGTPFTFTVVAGSLPPGLTMPSTYNPQSTIVTGTPSAQGTFRFTVKVTDGHKDTAEGNFSLVVGPTPPLTVSGTANCTADGGTFVSGVCDLPAASLGQGYETLIQASGGVGSPASFTFTVVAGSLPAGLTMPTSYGAAGTIIAGTPTAQGTFAFTIRVTDPNGDSGTGNFSLTVGPPPPLVASPCCADGTVGVAYAQNFFGQGGVAPYSWSVVSGQLPPGLGLSSPNPPTVDNRLSGTPTTAGTFTFMIRVTDSRGAQATGQDSVTIHPPLVDATPNNLPAGKVGVAYSQHLTAQGGLAPYSWSIVSGQLPPGLFLGSTSPDFNNVLTGTPTTAGTFTFTLQVTDALGDQATGKVSVTINP